MYRYTGTGILNLFLVLLIAFLVWYRWPKGHNTRHALFKNDGKIIVKKSKLLPETTLRPVVVLVKVT